MQLETTRSPGSWRVLEPVKQSGQVGPVLATCCCCRLLIFGVGPSHWTPCRSLEPGPAPPAWPGEEVGTPRVPGSLAQGDRNWNRAPVPRGQVSEAACLIANPHLHRDARPPEAELMDAGAGPGRLEGRILERGTRNPQAASPNGSDCPSCAASAPECVRGMNLPPQCRGCRWLGTDPSFTGREGTRPPGAGGARRPARANCACVSRSRQR